MYQTGGVWSSLCDFNALGNVKSASGSVSSVSVFNLVFVLKCRIKAFKLWTCSDYSTLIILGCVSVALSPLGKNSWRKFPDKAFCGITYEVCMFSCPHGFPSCTLVSSYSPTTSSEINWRIWNYFFCAPSNRLVTRSSAGCIYSVRGTVTLNRIKQQVKLNNESTNWMYL